VSRSVHYNQGDLKANLNAPLGGSGWVARVAAASLSRDGYGKNLVTDQEVSDKEILAARATIGYVGNPDFWVKVTADWMDDKSGVRGAQMLAPNTNAVINVRNVPPLDHRYDVRNGMPNINNTSMDGASVTVGWNLGDAWTLKSITAFRESDTETNIDFDTLPQKIADVKAFYNDEQTSQEFQLNYDNAGGRSAAWRPLLVRRRSRWPGAQQLLQPELRRYPGRGRYRQHRGLWRGHLRPE
jgi:iron complex outermembrane receptor protein